MFRRQFLVGLLLLPFAVATTPLRAADQTILDAEMFKKVLKPPTPDDEKWIDYIVTQVDQGKLPLDLVESSFQWARKKSKNQYQYFKAALILRAERQGIVLRS